MYEITQQEVDGDFSKMHVKLKFRVTEIIGQDAITEFAGHEVLKDHVRRQVRRYRGKIDDVIDAITEDGYYVRIKPFMITQGRVKTSQKQGIREACRNTVLQAAARNTWVSLQKLMLTGELEQMIDKAVRKVASVKTIIIRKSQLVQDGVIVEDGPTLDEIREEEDRVAAARKQHWLPPWPKRTTMKTTLPTFLLRLKQLLAIQRKMMLNHQMMKSQLKKMWKKKFKKKLKKNPLMNLRMILPTTLQ